MAQHSVYRSDRFFLGIALTVALLVLVGGAILTAGWLFDPARMQMLGLHRHALTPAVGICLTLAGASLALQWGPPVAAPLPNDVWRSATIRAGRILALLLGLIGALSLAVQILPAGDDMRRVLRASPMLALSITASLGFLLTGLCLSTIDMRVRSGSLEGHSVAEFGTIALLGAMGIPLISTLYSAAAEPVSTAIVVPPQLPLIFVLLALGMLAARPRHRMMALWTSTAPGGQLLRQLLPQSLVLLVSLDLLVEWGKRQGYYGQAQVSPLLILLSCSWLSILFWRAATLLNREHAVRRQGEAALSETNALLRVVSDNTPDCIFLRDREGRFIFANPALATLLGKNAEEIIGHGIRDVMADVDDAAMIEKNDHAVLEAGRALGVEEILHLGTGTRIFHSTRAPWVGDRKEALGVVGISTDITERKRAEDALRAHEYQLEELVAARTQEVRELMGHLESTREEEKRAIARELHDELGAALTALGMHLTILFQKMPKEPALEERAAQLRTLLTSIVQTTRRIQRGLRPDKLDVFGIKSAIAEQVQDFAEYSGVSCKVSVPDEDVHYSPQIDIALFRMVQEALNNIAKHAKARNVAVVLDDTDEAIMLTVRDDGVGLPENFVTGTATHGLRGMRERAGFLGGTVSVDSRPGKGTRIRVEIPKTRAHHAAIHALPESRPAGTSPERTEVGESSLPHSVKQKHAGIVGV